MEKKPGTGRKWPCLNEMPIMRDITRYPLLLSQGAVETIDYEAAEASSIV